MSVKHWINCLGLLLVVIGNGARAEAGLNGAAVYSELGHELFIAALYSSQPGTNAQELINGSYPKRIELKVTSPQGITLRQFNRLWRESVAINNARDVLITQAGNMVYFEGLILDRLELNDHLVISLIPDEGVSVSLNTVPLGHIKSDAFFGMLLQSWIGQVPPSSMFRDDLLKMNEADPTVVNRFTHMYPRNNRIDIVKRWQQPPAATIIPVTQQKIAAETSQTAAVVIKSAQRDAATPPNPVFKETAKKETQVPVATQKESVKTALTANAIDDSQARPTYSDAQVLLAKQFYIADVFKKIYAQVNYPRRAQELRQIGTVKLSVVIDAVGNVKAVASIDESRFMMLNKAALAAVNSAAPFPPLPQGLDVAELELFVPITFSLGVM